MRAKTDWVRFLLVSLVGAVGIFALNVAWHGYVVHDMYANYPLRPDDQMRALMPFLLFTYILQLPTFCYIYLRVYRKRTLANAIWWGAWGSLFVLAPDLQYFVGIPGMGWGLLAMQLVEGMVMMMILMAYFSWAYRPRPLGNVQEPAQVDTDWARFLPTAIIVSLVIGVIDLAFHSTVAPRLFPGVYPAADYPQRDPAEVAPLLPLLMSGYVLQIGLFFYLFLRIYPARGWRNAVWWGLWGSLFIYIFDAQIFVSEDKYTWTMLGIQLVEGVLLPLIMVLTFELVFRPRTGRVASGHRAAASAGI